MNEALSCGAMVRIMVFEKHKELAGQKGTFKEQQCSYEPTPQTLTNKIRYKNPISTKVHPLPITNPTPKKECRGGYKEAHTQNNNNW